MERRVALPLIQNARARLTQAEAICKAGYACDSVIAESESIAIRAMVLDAMESLRSLKIRLDQMGFIQVEAAGGK